MLVMTEGELHETLSRNIKKYRRGKYTQEQLAEKIGVSTQNINDIEGKRRWPREGTLVKIADALEIEVFQLFVSDELPRDFDTAVTETDEAQTLTRSIRKSLASDLRKSMNKMLDKWEDS